MTYTNEQIRGAILRAADHIESNPDKLDHGTAADFGGAACCILVHIGTQLGLTGHSAIHVADICGIKQLDCNHNALFDFMNRRDPEWDGTIFGKWTDDAALTASGLRAFANELLMEAA